MRNPKIYLTITLVWIILIGYLVWVNGLYARGDKMKKQELRHDAFRENVVKCIEYFNENSATVLKIFFAFLPLGQVYV